MRDICAVSFDVGGTLITPWPSVGHVYAAAGREAGFGEMNPEHLNARFGAAWAAKLQFDYSLQAWADLVVATFGGSSEQFGLKTVFFEKLYRRFEDPSVWRVYGDVVPTLEALRQRGLKLAIVSNWDDRLRPLLRNLKLDGYFQVIEASSDSGFQKPAPQIFRRATEALQLPEKHVLHVGDSRQEDYDGARGAGLHSLLLKRGRPGRKEGELSELTELFEIISCAREA